MAQRLFLQSIADQLEEMRVDDSYIIEIFKAINETVTLGIGDDEDSNNSTNGSSSGSNSSASAFCDLEVFDKNEANIFAEPQKVIYDAIVVFKNTFTTRPKVLRYVGEVKPL